MSFTKPTSTLCDLNCSYKFVWLLVFTSSGHCQKINTRMKTKGTVTVHPFPNKTKLHTGCVLLSTQAPS